MAGPGSFFAGGFALAVQNVRTRILDRDIRAPGLEVILDQYVCDLSTLVRTLVLLELVFNGSTINRETWILSKYGHFLSLPFYRISGTGRLEVFFTNTGATIGAACNVSGRYVYPGSLPFED